MEGTPYASGVGSIMYGMVCSRPDLAYAGGLKYTRAAQDEDALEGYVDADYAGNVDTRKSLSGFVFTLYGTTISWKANQQSVVALSTTQAEYIALVEGVKEAIWFACRTGFTTSLMSIRRYPSLGKTKIPLPYYKKLKPKTKKAITFKKPKPLQWISRTHHCGELSSNDVGKTVRLCGWVALHRRHGEVAFLILRDHTGIIQVTTHLNEFPVAHSANNNLRREYVVTIQGVVRSCPTQSINNKMKTGFIEVAANEVQELNSRNANVPIFSKELNSDDAEDSLKEEIRLRYRCLDLRKQQMNSNILLRHNVVKLIRRYLEDIHGFAEIETPILSRSTLKGAREFLVPSRIQRGTFYALPQSPQIYNQMLMVAGFDKYYQVARCFRDEDLRAVHDRQPEFTQLDMEMAFTPLEDILSLNEELIRKVFLEIKGVELPNPFPRLTYAEAMNRYGSDHPDTRFDLELKNVSDIFSRSSFKIFSDSLACGGVIKVLCVPYDAKKCYYISGIYNEAYKSGAKGLLVLKIKKNGKLAIPYQYSIL
ncbi:aspartate--tRNA ligase, chloroplastic/mitochondrial [Medicago truncatula]|uniref:aspartate--tRNA ligase, chloroplastic/mitochondrial n=1 Tax=Medicago truncatula TaxID=3880 RepID=UPI001967661B|nr:aspartate--tRNA ligase, chloroplastic/mitochondrial-like [Medicago truncatula]